MNGGAATQLKTMRLNVIQAHDAVVMMAVSLNVSQFASRLVRGDRA